LSCSSNKNKPANGEFRVYTSVYNATSANPQTDIKDIKVILQFEKLDDVNKLFDKLRNELPTKVFK
jgi:hypothetical protein